jgi:CRISPR-associated endonuclease Csn1
MYLKEFDSLWSAQVPHHADLLTDDIRQKAHHLIFYQRPIRIPKSLIGTCELETNRRRCPRADRRAQKFRMLVEVNNLLLIDQWGEERPPTPGERRKLLDYLGSAKSRSFDDIRKHLELGDAAVFNLERAGRKTLWGMPTDKAMSHKDRFGKEWDGFDEEKKNRIVRSLIDEDEKVVLERAQSQWGLKEEQANALLDADMPEGYMSFSREAIAKLLPHLEKGMPLMTADDRPCAITAAGYLRPDQRPVKRLDRLPQPPDVPNPIVRQALHEVHKVVNATIREYGRPDRIHIELAREVKGSLEDRKRYTYRIRDREAQRDNAADAIRASGVKPSREAIDRYLLWREQKETCIYTGNQISLTQLLRGEADVDHILPKPRSLDDSMMNKVVCFRQANGEKGGQTPYEWLAMRDPERYAAICLRARKLPYGKYRKFLQKEVKLDDFIHRQLNDTAYISRAVRQYLLPLVENPHADIFCTKGQLTAELRRGWGLNNVLRDDGLNLKSREDHRHHAVDAIVIALTDRSRLQRLAAERACPPPRDHFFQEVQDVINSINVSHRVRRKIAGKLHEETIYGKTPEPGVFAYRKPLASLTLNEVENIRDEEVRKKVLARLKEFGITAGRKKKGQDSPSGIPAETWKKPLWMNEEKQIPIFKVRLTKPEKTILPIRGGAAWVKPGSTHHLCLFELPNGKHAAVFVTMLQAARRAAKGETIINRTHPDHPDATFIMSLSKGEMVLVKIEGKARILQYDTAASTTQQMKFTDPTDARPSAEKDISRYYPSTFDKLEPRKIAIDPLGRIRWAND